MDERDVVHRLQNLQRTLLTRAPLRHSIIAVERGDGSFRWSDAIGEVQPGGVAIRPDTPYFIASIDKLFTATVARFRPLPAVIGHTGSTGTWLFYPTVPSGI